MMALGLRAIMHAPGFALGLMLVAALGLSSCVPDMVTLEAVPTPTFARDLAQCQAEANDGLGNPVKRCMKAKGYRFLRQY